MEEDLKKSLLTVCRTLELRRVRYMLVGGTAVALHGHYRHSMGPSGQLASKPDIDLWFNPTYDNYFNLLKALEELDCDASAFMNEQRPEPKQSFFRLDMDGFTLDALPTIQADIPFNDAFARKETVMLDGTPIHYIGFDDLMEDKRRSARKKDLDDMEHLKRHKGD